MNAINIMTDILFVILVIFGCIFYAIGGVYHAPIFLGFGVIINFLQVYVIMRL